MMMSSGPKERGMKGRTSIMFLGEVERSYTAVWFPTDILLEVHLNIEDERIEYKM